VLMIDDLSIVGTTLPYNMIWPAWLDALDDGEMGGKNGCKMAGRTCYWLLYWARDHRHNTFSRYHPHCLLLVAGREQLHNWIAESHRPNTCIVTDRSTSITHVEKPRKDTHQTSLRLRCRHLYSKNIGVRSPRSDGGRTAYAR
jgi:hypothetical protein